MGQKQGKAKRKRNHQKGLKKELIHDLGTNRTHRFADSYFFGALFGASRAQIHEIDTGQQQHKQTAYAKQPHILDFAARIDAIFKIRIQMPLAHRVQKNLGFFLGQFFTDLVQLGVFNFV